MSALMILRFRGRTSPWHPLVTVVTVTYGDRLHLVRQVVDRALQMPDVRDVVVVDNASVNDLSELVSSGRVTIVRQPGNTGSAAGFWAGMQAALVHNPSELYLLDDDNVPEPDAIEKLRESLRAWPPGTVGLSYRASRTEQSELLNDGRPVRMTPDAFSEFSIGRFLSHRLRHDSGKVQDIPPTSEPRTVEFAPYGGLLLPADLVARIGPPRLDYYLYVDDHEYTHRIHSSGTAIVLVPDSVVHDIDETWHTVSDRIPPQYQPGAADRRIYYAMRNRVDFEWRKSAHNKLAYLCNAGAFLTVVTVKALLNRASPTLVARRLALMTRAIKDGLSGRLGQVERL